MASDAAPVAWGGAGAITSPGAAPIRGDALCLGGAALYACSNVAQERLVRDRGDGAFLGRLGVSAFLVSAAQAVVLERDAVARADAVLARDVGAAWLFAGYVASMASLYVLAAWFFRRADAAAFNLSLLASDAYAVAFAAAVARVPPRAVTNQSDVGIAISVGSVALTPRPRRGSSRGHTIKRRGDATRFGYRPGAAAAALLSCARRDGRGRGRLPRPAVADRGEFGARESADAVLRRHQHEPSARGAALGFFRCLAGALIFPRPYLALARLFCFNLAFGLNYRESRRRLDASGGVAAATRIATTASLDAGVEPRRRRADRPCRGEMEGGLGTA